MESAELRMEKFLDKYAISFRELEQECAETLDHMLPSGIRETLSAKSEKALSGTHLPDLIQKLPFSHFAELLRIDEKRTRTDGQGQHYIAESWGDNDTE